MEITKAVSADNSDPSGVRTWAVSTEFAEKLWRLSENLTAIKFLDEMTI